MAENDNQGGIGFRTAGEWTVGDLTSLSQSVAGVYDAFLTAKVRRRLEENYLESCEAAFLEWEKLAPDPFSLELAHMWRRALRAWQKGRGMRHPPLPFFPVLPWYPGLEGALPSDESVFTALGHYASESDRLRVVRIRMSSPGGFSFEGLGEIVHEIRELIKDFWWRNRAERASDQLDLVEKYLKIRADHPDLPLPPPPYLRRDRFLAESVQGHLDRLRELEEKGKLESVPQHLDYLPPGGPSEEGSA